MTDRLDSAIRAILTDPDTRLSAEAINALHGATSTHPWAAGKDLDQRAQEALCAIAARNVPAAPRLRIERTAQAAWRRP